MSQSLLMAVLGAALIAAPQAMAQQTNERGGAAAAERTTTVKGSKSNTSDRKAGTKGSSNPGKTNLNSSRSN